MTSAATVVAFDPLKDSRHRDARSARDQADWLAWLDLGGAAPRTLADYEWATARLLRFYPHKTFAEITDADLLHVMRDFPARSRRERVAALRSWFRWGVQTRRLERNPFDLLPTIKRQPQRHIEVFSDPEIARLIALPENDGNLFQILFDTGLRRGEAIALQRRDFKNGELIVRRGKGGKFRNVPLFTRLEERLDLWFASEGLAPTDHLWATRPGGYYLQRRKPMGNTSFTVWYRRCLDVADVPYRNPHVTRHTFATRWLRRGGRLETLSRVMGHASIRTTFDLYAHLDTQDVLRDLYLIEGGRK
jgi:integrase